MTRRLVVTYFTITAIALASLAIPLGINFARGEKDRLLFAIERDADAMSSLVQSSVERGKPPPRADILRYAARTGGHVIVVDTRGVALLDTQYPNGPARNFSSRPEVAQALSGERADGSRVSDTLHTNLIYVAVPIQGAGAVKGAVRITYPSATLDARVRRAWSRLALLCLLVLCVVMLVGWLLARGVTRPVRRLEEAADRVAAGDFATRVAEQPGPPELRSLVQAFNRMAGEVSRLMAAQQQFVADASHQLRSPLTALRLRLENLDARLGADDRRAVGAAADEVSRLSLLVDGLLVLARDAGDAPAELVDVAAVARARVDAWADVVAEREVHLAVEAPGAAWATVVPGAVEQCVDNLVDNALSVSAPGATVTVRVVAGAGLVELHVLDEGPGLDAAARARAFDRFWRAPDAPAGGSGIGLAIVRRLAESSGGTARLDARAAGGVDAVVAFSATRVRPADGDARGARAERPPGDTSGGSGAPGAGSSRSAYRARTRS